MNEEALSLSQELTDALAPTYEEIVQDAARYVELKAAHWVVPATGEKMTQKEMKDSLDALNDRLKRYIDEHGPVSVEGVGALRLQSKSEWSMTSGDLMRLKQERPALYAELEQSCLVIDKKRAEAQNLWGAVKPWRVEGNGTPSLIIDRGQ